MLGKWSAWIVIKEKPPVMLIHMIQEYAVCTSFFRALRLTTMVSDLVAYLQRAVGAFQNPRRDRMPLLAE